VDRLLNIHISLVVQLMLICDNGWRRCCYSAFFTWHVILWDFCFTNLQGFFSLIQGVLLSLLLNWNLAVNYVGCIKNKVDGNVSIATFVRDVFNQRKVDNSIFYNSACRSTNLICPEEV
jgi:hypothetical protein